MRSTADAEERSAFIRACVWECIGGKPDQTPLNPVVTGVIEREKYRIESIDLVDLFPQTFHLETVVVLRRKA